MDFDDLLFRAVNLLELFEEVRERYTAAFRHVLVDEYQDTNHAQYRLLQLLVGGGREHPAGGSPSGGQRASRPGHRNLAVVGDDSQSIYGFRGADIRNILDFQEDFPDARVVKLEQNYRSTQTILSAANAVIANNRGGIAKRLWSDLGRGRADRGPRARRRARRGALRGRRDRAAARRGREPRGDRGLLPHQRDVAGARGHAGAPRDRLPGDRRHQVLRARRDQGRDRLPVAARQPSGRGELRARRQLPPARDRADLASAGCSPTRRRIDVPVWEAAAGAEEVPGLGGSGAQGARALHGHDGRAAPARRRARPDRGAAGGRALAERLRRGAGDRTHDRGAGAHREPRAARRGRARVRRRRRALAGDPRRVPRADRARRRRRLAPRGRKPGDADDAAQREGPRVPDRVLQSAARTASSPTRARSTKGAWRRSGACSTLASPARCAACT